MRKNILETLLLDKGDKTFKHSYKPNQTVPGKLLIRLVNWLTCSINNAFTGFSCDSTENPAHRILFSRNPRGWTTLRGRPHASCLRQAEAYMRDMGITGMASAWTMARRRTKVYRGCRVALLRRMLPYLTYIDDQ